VRGEEIGVDGYELVEQLALALRLVRGANREGVGAHGQHDGKCGIPPHEHARAHRLTTFSTLLVERQPRRVTGKFDRKPLYVQQ
jgi:hypothetical protein